MRQKPDLQPILVTSEASIKKLPLPPDGKDWVRYQDATIRALYVRVTKSGAKSFVLLKKLVNMKDTSLNGKVIDMVLGGDITLQQARSLAQRTLGQIAEGIDPRKPKRVEGYTLGDAFTFWFLYAKAEKRDKGTEDRRQYDAFLKAWENRRLDGITRQDVEKWHERIGENHGKVAANRGHSLLRAAINHCIKGGRWAGINPAIGIDRNAEVARERFLDGDELRAFLTALSEEEDPVGRDFIWLSLMTGARRANVLGMRWSAIDLTRGLWRIDGDEAKAGVPLVLVLPAPAIALLRERRKQTGKSPWVLPSSGSKSGHLTEPRCTMERVLARAELRRLLEMIAQARGDDSNATAALVIEADIYLRDLRAKAFAIAGSKIAKGQKRKSPWDTMLDKYRADAVSLGIDPDAARMSDVHVHDLRRTLASHMAMSGTSLAIIGKTLGHSGPQATAIYARLSLDPVRESVGRAVDSILSHAEVAK